MTYYEAGIVQGNQYISEETWKIIAFVELKF